MVWNSSSRNRAELQVRIKLTKSDSPDGFHHYIPLTWVSSVEGNTVHLVRDATAVRRVWQSENREDISQTQSIRLEQSYEFRLIP